MEEKILALVEKLISTGGSVAIWSVVIIYLTDIIKSCFPWIVALFGMKWLFAAIKESIMHGKIDGKN